tara:strand:- start:308 stop:538 length:231 start_codon:yes stop_codon:yes gene_type:complete
MIFDQKEDGSCEIVFSEEEVKIITQHKKLYLTQEFLRHFSNTLVNITIEFNKRFDEKTKKIKTFNNTRIISNKPLK